MKPSRKDFLTLSLIATSYLGILSGCGGGKITPEQVEGFTGRIQGALDYVNKANAAWNNLVVTIKGTSTAGATIEQQATVDSTTGKFDESVPEGNYAVEIKDKTGSFVEITVPNIAIKKDDKQLIRPNGQDIIDLVPSGVSVKTIEITIPTNAIPPGSIYTFSARVLDNNNAALTGWEPRWRLEGNIGSLDTNTGKLIANAGGTGKIVAFFYIGNRLVEAKADIVVQDEILTSAPVLCVLRPVSSSSNAVYRYDTRSGQELSKTDIKNVLNTDSIAVSGDGKIYVTKSNGATSKIQFLKADGTLDIETDTVNDDFEAIGILPNGNIIAFNDDGFHIFDKNNGRLLNDKGRLDNVFSDVYDIKVGPDGKLYVVGITSTAYVVNRYITTTDNITLEKTILSFDRLSTSRVPSAVVFASNGDMLISDTKSDQILRYSIDGVAKNERQSVDGLSSAAMAIGKNVKSNNDEVIFVYSNTARSIMRVYFNNGVFIGSDKLVDVSSFFDMEMS